MQKNKFLKNGLQVFTASMRVNPAITGNAPFVKWLKETRLPPHVGLASCYHKSHRVNGLFSVECKIVHVGEHIFASFFKNLALPTLTITCSLGEELVKITKEVSRDKFQMRF